ncbi:MAG TPA: glycoside-pentoside-hexuronide (GPH):cation symporter [Galbitalea sp.]|jgi:GPH family glycoside/pentoside/hexuronide:cation symporter|nr:glycoside-pentoside-hexuronide (GPH):cation symporter [Galbitalea sp.]
MTTATREPRIYSPRTQSRAIVTAAFGQNAILTTVTTFIIGYLSKYASFSAQAIGIASLIIGIVKIADAVTDPIMGSVIDQTHSRWGKLRPFILFSAAPVAVLTGLLFTVPNTGQTSQLIYFGIIYVIWGVVYTVCDVPLWALIGSAFVDPTMRNRVVGNVRAFGSISLGLATLGLPYLAQALSFAPQTTADGWSRAVFVVAILGMALYLLAFFFGRERQTTAQTRLSFRQLFSTLFKNTPLLMVLLASVLGFGRNIVQAGGQLFAFMAYGKSPIYFTYIGGSLIVGLVVAAFVTPLLLRYVAPKTAAIGSSLIGAVLYVITYFLGFDSLIEFMIAIFLTGLTLGVFLVIQASMIADAVDDVEKRTGVRNDGISFATLTFSSKIMAGLSVIVFGAFVAIAHYQNGVKVTHDIQNVIFLSITIVPAISCVLSAIPFFFYRLGGPRLPSMQK